MLFVIFSTAMPVLPPESHDRLLVAGTAAIVAAAAWVAATLWVDRDSREIVDRPSMWRTVFLGLGLALLFATAGVGPEPLGLLFAVAFPLGLLAYVGVRDLAAPAERRLLPEKIVEGLLRPATQGLRLSNLIRGRSTVAGDVPVKDVVVLLKKDGTRIDGREPGEKDKETSKAVLAVQQLMAKAIVMRATDIHLEPKTGDELQVRFRIDGVLQNSAGFSGSEGRALVSATKVVADMDIAERRRPQDGTFAALCGDRKFDIRAATGPTNFGEKMVLRLLDSDGGLVRAGLGAIGMRESVLKSLRSIIQRPHGMLIVCGPTGSGKTTTVYAAIGEIDVFSRNIVTIEDPIEYRLDNISQTAVNVSAELTFAKILRSVLRQDPDVILVGEIRDRETAEIAMQAALTGHFVFTTLHANDTATTVARLLDIGIDATLIQSAVTAVLAQRLVRVLCAKCKVPYKPPPEFLARCGLDPAAETTFYRENEKGCRACVGTGFRGRTGVYELLVFDNTIKDLLVGRPSIQAIRAAAKKAGMRTLQDSAMQKVVSGMTSLSEVARVTKQ
jgi:type II secretory ATPase GspE/PulE/Tfp pilus assembly ATPase PilB-like protein